MAKLYADEDFPGPVVELLQGCWKTSDQANQGVAMNILGHVQNGVVIFNDGMSLPDGTAVRVEPLDRADQPAGLQEQLLDWAGKGVDLPVDLARRHDHYLHRPGD